MGRAGHLPLEPLPAGPAGPPQAAVPLVQGPVADPAWGRLICIWAGGQPLPGILNPHQNRRDSQTGIAPGPRFN